MIVKYLLSDRVRLPKEMAQLLTKRSISESSLSSESTNLKDLQWRDLQKYEYLRELVPLAMALKIRDPKIYVKLVNSFVASPSPSSMQTFTIQVILSQTIDTPEIFLQSLDAFLKHLNQPILTLIKHEILAFVERSSIDSYISLVKILIQRAALSNLKSNIKFIEYLIIKLYKAQELCKDSKEQRGIISLASLSLYCDLSLHLLDNTYFDRFRELAELQMALPHGNDQRYLLQLVLLFKRISASTKTDYSEKLLDTVEMVLARLNKPITDQTSD